MMGEALNGDTLVRVMARYIWAMTYIPAKIDIIMIGPKNSNNEIIGDPDSDSGIGWLRKSQTFRKLQSRISIMNP